MMNKLYAILSVVLLLSACYDDEGNYDYKDIDEIRLTFPESTGSADKITYSGKIGDTLLICPQVNYKDSARLAYTWERYTAPTGVSLEKLGNEKELNIWLNPSDTATYRWKTGRYLLKYKVQDTVTLQTTHIMLNLIVRSPHPTGVYLLHGNATESDIATLENDDFTEGMEEQVFQPAYYSGQLGRKLQGEGRSISWLRSFEDGYGLFVFTDHDGKYIDLTSFTEDYGLDDMFGGQAPSEIAITQFVTYPPMAVSVLYAGEKVYASYGSAAYEPFFELSSIDDMQGKIPAYFDSDAGAGEGDLGEGNLAFATGSNRFFIYSYSEAEMVNPCPDDPYGPVWNPSEMEDGMELIGVDYGKPSGWYGFFQQQWALFRDETGNIRAYRVNPGAASDEKPVYDKALTLATADMNPDLLAMNCFTMSSLSEGLGYFSTPDAVWSADVINNPELVEIFRPENPGEKVTRIKLLKSNNLENIEMVNEVFKARLCLSLYVVTWDGSSGRLYRIPVNTEGHLDGSRRIEKFEGLGEVRDLTFRLQ